MHRRWRTAFAALAGLLLATLDACPGCGTPRTRPVAAEALLAQLSSEFRQPAMLREPGLSAREPHAPFAPRTAHPLQTLADGSMRWVARSFPLKAGSPPSARLDAQYGATAADGIRLSLPGRPDVWLRMRPIGGEISRREEARGYFVYPQSLPGADAIYLTSRGRVEEFLNIRGDAPLWLTSTSARASRS